jgi:hypothetical protein
LLDERGVPHWHTGPDLRLVHSGELVFAFNYGPDTEDLGARAIGPSDQEWLLGGPCLPPAGVAAWKAERTGKQADTPVPGSG